METLAGATPKCALRRFENRTRNWKVCISQAVSRFVLEDLTPGLWLTHLWRTLPRSESARFTNLPTFLEAFTCDEKLGRLAMPDEVTSQTGETLSQRDSKRKRPCRESLFTNQRCCLPMAWVSAVTSSRENGENKGTCRIGQWRSLNPASFRPATSNEHTKYHDGPAHPSKCYHGGLAARNSTQARAIYLTQ